MGKPSTSVRVLVVEDDTDTAKTISRILRLQGSQVRTVHDGESAIAACLDFEPELGIIDIGLPDVDGYTVAKRLREECGLRDIPLLAISGFSRARFAEEASAAGFTTYLMKPIEAEELQGWVDAIKRTRGILGPKS